MSKSMNKSTSKNLKSPHKRYPDEDDFISRPRAQSQKQKIGLAKKSHQGSYMIGVEPGVDWPLEPKWKAEGGKIKNGLRRR
jgi:hypothetical protein